MARTGVFGGTFDPPHVGHLMVAQDVAEALALDRLWLVPAGAPPHKPDQEPAPAELRARMVEAGVAAHPRLAVSRIELERPGPSYTVDTLAELAARAPEDELFLVVGVDQLRAFSSWRSPDGILRLARLAVMAREGVEPGGAAPGGDVPHQTVPVTRVDVSSSEIRRRIAQGRSIRYWVPDSVLKIIQDEKLYGCR